MESFQGIMLDVDYISGNGEEEIYQFSFFIDNTIICDKWNIDGYYECRWEVTDGVQLLYMHNWFNEMEMKLIDSDI